MTSLVGNSGSRRTLNFLMCTNGVFLCVLDDVNAYLDRWGVGSGPDCKLNFETVSSTRYMNVHTVDKLQSKTSRHALNVLSMTLTCDEPYIRLVTS